MAYFDHSATAQPDPAILTRYFEAMQESWYNPASIYPEGRAAAKLIETCKERLNIALAERAVPGASGNTGTWLLTSGASESIVTAIRGTLQQRGGTRSWTIGFDGDHQATLQTLKDLKQDEWPKSLLPINSAGEPDIAALETELKKRREAGDAVRLITVLYVNNETGALADIEAIHELRKQFAPDALLHLDLVQAPGRHPLDLNVLKPDLASFSGHKLGAPRGVGFLYLRPGLHLRPLMKAGGQQDGLRGGTENAPLFEAMTTALLQANEQVEEQVRHAIRLREITLSELDAHGLGYELNTGMRQAAPTPAILNIAFPGLKGETLLHLLEREDFQLSTASACTTKRGDSHVLTAMELPKEQRQGSLRISFALSNTEDEARQLGQAIAKHACWLHSVLN